CASPRSRSIFLPAATRLAWRIAPDRLFRGNVWTREAWQNTVAKPPLRARQHHSRSPPDNNRVSKGPVTWNWCRVQNMLAVAANPLARTLSAWPKPVTNWYSAAARNGIGRLNATSPPTIDLPPELRIAWTPSVNQSGSGQQSASVNASMSPSAARAPAFLAAYDPGCFS